MAIGERRVEHQLSHAQQRVERRANLATHAGQKLALGMVRLFSMTPRLLKFSIGLGQLLRSLHNSTFQFVLYLRQSKTHGIQRLGQVADFVARIDVGLRAQLAGRDCGCRLDHRQDGTSESLGNPIADRHTDQEHRRSKGDQQPAEAGYRCVGLGHVQLRDEDPGRAG